jgi:hypothetical protein
LTAIFLFLYLVFFSKRENISVADSTDVANGTDDIKLKPRRQSGAVQEGIRGDARTCPICAARFEHGEKIKSKIFPPSGRPYRLLHILGCSFCLEGERRRLCPVCGAELSTGDYLVARIWQNPIKPQVRIQGCLHCFLKGGRRK